MRIFCCECRKIVGVKSALAHTITMLVEHIWCFLALTNDETAALRSHDKLSTHNHSTSWWHLIIFMFCCTLILFTTATTQRGLLQHLAGFKFYTFIRVRSEKLQWDALHGVRGVLGNHICSLAQRVSERWSWTAASSLVAWDDELHCKQKTQSSSKSSDSWEK